MTCYLKMGFYVGQENQHKYLHQKCKNINSYIDNTIVVQKK